jgi:hypothetical protein
MWVRDHLPVRWTVAYSDKVQAHQWPVDMVLLPPAIEPCAGLSLLL